MCGLLAIARSRPLEGNALPARALERAMARLARRGPDGHGTYQTADRRVLLAHTRLAIQDLTDAGRQPMSDREPDPTISVTFNGEIYNAPALRRELERVGYTFRSHADTEVLVHGYAHWGIDGVLERLCGMFAFVLLDQRAPNAPIIHGAVDPASMKPLTWAFINDAAPRLAIASDCDTILAAWTGESGFLRRLDAEGLCHVLSVGYCPAPGTVWRGINKLRPGEKLTWRVGNDATPTISRYWHAPENLHTTTARDEQDQFEQLWRTIVDEHMLADVPVGLFLSAGLDSSSVALALAQSGRCNQVTAYTLTASGIDSALNECPLAGAFASAMMMRHKPIEFAATDLLGTLRDAGSAFDEPQGFTALLTAMTIARRTREHGPTVVIGGDGGDEVLAGYPWHTGANHPLSLDPAFLHAPQKPLSTMRLAMADCPPAERAAAMVQLARSTYTHRYLCRVYPGFHPVESRALLVALEPTYDEERFAAWLAVEDRPNLPHPRRSQRLDIMGFCAGSILPKIDRSAMHVGLEIRSPFLDRRMLDWALGRAIADDETHAETSKPVLRRFLGRGVEAGLVPRQVLTRPKQGFSLRLADARPFHSISAQMLPESRLMRDGVLRQDFTSFLPSEAATREVRLFSLCMMAAWYESRAG